LPETAWIRLNRSFDDHLNGGDAGLYDLLLNPRDRAYTVPQLATLLESADLRPACWVEPLRYDPAPLLLEPKLRARLDGLDPTGRAALAESLAGNMAVHIVYCVRAQDPHAPADPYAPDAVPVTREMPGTHIADAIQRDGTLAMNFDGLRLPVPLPPLAAPILRLIDGARSVSEIAATLAERGTGPEAFDRAWRATYPRLEAINRLLLAPPRAG
ncbi:MAG: methyltransferase, partial [Rhodospirillales bacterium]|nr:methyltransferase [Rhodospirillales bacterium]